MKSSSHESGLIYRVFEWIYIKLDSSFIHPAEEDYYPVYEKVVLTYPSNEACVYIHTLEDYMLEGQEELAVDVYFDYEVYDSLGYYPENVNINNSRVYILIVDDES